MTIKELLEDKQYVIVLDTNVLLNVYRYSPEFSEFSLSCLKVVGSYIYLPATVHLEFEKHYRGEFKKMKKRVSDAGKETENQINLAKQKIVKTCDNLERLHFPDIDILRDDLSEKMDDVLKSLSDFFGDRPILDLIQDFWDEVDHIQLLVLEIENMNHIFPPISQKDIYRWCEEGERRYKKQIPPGFMDAKNKDGIKKYSDLIIWNEILEFVKRSGLNIIFVTDDAKTDWWETANGNNTFHKELINEFSITKRQIIPLTSQVFFSEISSAYNIGQTDAVEIALRKTDEEYCDNIANAVFESIQDDLLFNIISYVDRPTAHIGSEGIDECELDDFCYVDGKRVDREDDIAIYHFDYSVRLTGTSYDYWGRDQDTHEVITSPGINHIFEGNIVVEVRRDADYFYDFRDLTLFESSKIIDGDLEEKGYEVLLDDYEMGAGEYGACPDCGRPLNYYNDGGNGFCVDCAPNH